jgi:hypothetical protein
VPLSPCSKDARHLGRRQKLALNELEAVKEGFIDVYLQMGKANPRACRPSLVFRTRSFSNWTTANALEPFVVGRLAESPLAHPTGDRCWRQGQLLIVNCQLSIVNYEWDHARAAHNRHMPCLPPTAPAGHARPGQARPLRSRSNRPAAQMQSTTTAVEWKRIKRTHHTLTKTTMTTTDIQPTWPASQTCRRDKRVLITGPAATLRTGRQQKVRRPFCETV